MTTQTKTTWRIMKFKDFADTSPSVKLERGKEYPFIPMDVVDGRRKFPVEIKRKNFSGGGAKFANGDTIFARITPCLENGKIVKIQGLKEGVGFGSTEFFVFRGKDGISDSDFVYYLSRTDTIRDPAVKSMVGASGRQRANKTVVDSVQVTAPDLSQQKQIASVLSTYDNLIENNTRRIEILEQIVQSTYTEWFVNFRFPGHEKVKIIDSDTEFGKIPDDWKVAKVGDIAEFMNGYAFKPRHLGIRGLPVIKIPELRSGVLSKTPRNSGESIPKKYFIKNGDILFSWSATLLVNIWNSGEGLLNQHLFKVTPKADYLYSFIFYFLANQIEKYRSHAVGATMQHLRRDVVINANVLLPNKDLLIKFENIVLDILKERSILIIENQNLRQTRDLLLPKLVTG